VLAVDLDARFLLDAAGPTLEVRQQDIVAQPPPEKAFDFVHARLLLYHLQAREKVLEQFVASLKPGGWILLEEMETFSALQNAPGPARQIAEALLAVGKAAGHPPEWARTLPARLQELGLSNVGAEGEVIFFPGGSIAADFHQLTSEQLRPHAVKMGLLKHEDFDRYAEALRNPTSWFFGPTMYGIWGQRPPG
jgi:SAM-dependent methyltransferase